MWLSLRKILGEQITIGKKMITLILLQLNSKLVLQKRRKIKKSYSIKINNIVIRRNTGKNQQWLKSNSQIVK